MGRWPFAAVAICFLAANGQGGPIQVTFSPSPATYTGACPVTVRFNGTITATGIPQVQYRIVRSDGVQGPVTTVNFQPAGGTHAVTGTWKITQNLSGWESLEILAPFKMKSNPATFSATCKTSTANILRRAQLGLKPKLASSLEIGGTNRIEEF